MPCLNLNPSYYGESPEHVVTGSWKTYVYSKHSYYGNGTDHVDHSGFSMGFLWPCTFTLLWGCTGEPITDCTFLQDVFVTTLCRQLDDGYYEEYGVPPTAALDDDSTEEEFLTYKLIYDGVVLEDGQFFSDYAIPPNAKISIILKHFGGESPDEK